jgi:hypothetical protein
MIHPWHMWGNSVSIKLNPGLDKAQTGQLARVEYKRPESWRFMFYARLLRSNVTAVPVSVVVVFNVFTGIGRANLQIQNNPFESYKFNITIAGEQGGPAYPVKWSTEVTGPKRIDDLDTSTSNCNVIVGQDIQVGFLAFLGNPGGVLPTDEAQLEIGCLLSPQSHVRPDWYSHGPMQFLGEENSGR